MQHVPILHHGMVFSPAFTRPALQSSLKLAFRQGLQKSAAVAEMMSTPKTGVWEAWRHRAVSVFQDAFCSKEADGF